MNSDSMETKIIDAAISCIEESGFHNATVRRIAAKAGVNMAAINYYFRTKEQLLERVIEVTLKNAFDWDDLTFTDAMPPREQLFAVIDHLAEGAQQYPEISRAHFYEPMVNGNNGTQAVVRMNDFLQTLFEKLREKLPAMSEKDLRSSINQIFMTGVFSMGVAPDITRAFLGVDLKDKAERAAYLRQLIDRLIDE